MIDTPAKPQARTAAPIARQLTLRAADPAAPQNPFKTAISGAAAALVRDATRRAEMQRPRPALAPVNAAYGFD